MPGVLDTTSTQVEHWRLVAQRLETFSDLLGMDRIMACSDGSLNAAAGPVAYGKLEAMVKGAAALADSPNKKARSGPMLSLLAD